MLWVGGNRKEGWWVSKQAYVHGKGRGFRGIFGIFQEPFQSGSRCIPLPRDLAEQADRQLSREGRKGEHHALLPISLVMLMVEDGTADTNLALKPLKQVDGPCAERSLMCHRHRATSEI
ncbi:hypothetical protein JOB18_010525 [Solea senegalensis]|uniref:Uncharacterized protein n=1 Tax=Solea senegalensis TaxID=28829 RepID=A0AAV6RX89_SOLSE|nr:hypothetical protein JOB18_010525 [Solea senegalensis]